MRNTPLVDYRIATLFSYVQRAVDDRIRIVISRTWIVLDRTETSVAIEALVRILFSLLIVDDSFLLIDR